MREYTITPEGDIEMDDEWGVFVISPRDINKSLKLLKKENKTAFKNALAGVI